jgi:hypothetical protein
VLAGVCLRVALNVDHNRERGEGVRKNISVVPNFERLIDSEGGFEGAVSRF